MRLPNSYETSELETQPLMKAAPGTTNVFAFSIGVAVRGLCKCFQFSNVDPTGSGDCVRRLVSSKIHLPVECTEYTIHLVF